MDEIDIQILDLLQKDGRMSTAEVARQVRLSAPAVNDRIKKMEEQRIIKGYTAIVDARKLGKDITAIISGRLDGIRVKETIPFLCSLPEVLDCHRITGEDCVLLKVKTRNSESLQALLEKLYPYIQSKTVIALSSPKETTRVMPG
jgi:Lrp/AsnC family transcriptional regulator, leucine-responsive regulatory protein